MKKQLLPNFTRSLLGASAFILLLAAGTTAHASATPTVFVPSVSPSSSVSVGTPVSFAVATTGFIDPYYSLSDAFVGGSLASIDLSSAGEFAWTPARNDVGSHVVTITAHDTLGDLATGTVTIVVTGSTSGTLSIQSVFPSSTINSGQTVTFSAILTGLVGTPSYTVSDSFSGSTVSSSDITTSGNFSWTPSASDVGSHTLTVTVTDSSGNTASGSVLLQVASAPVTTSYVSPAVPIIPVLTTTTVPADVFTENLTLASTGAQVTALQKLLIAQGDLTATATGYYGSATKAAVIKFQAANSISQLGIVGPSTRAALNVLEPGTTGTPSVTTTSTATVTPSGTTVAQIQSEIQSMQTELTQIESQLAQI